MKLRTVRIIAIVSLAFLPLLSAEAQQAGKVHKIGFLIPASSALAPIRLEPFRQGLREIGYIEGRDIVIEARWGEGDFARLPALAAELVRLQVDVIVTAATPAALAAKDATSTIPIVMVDPGDPVRTGLVASLAKPGGNATGLSSVTPDIAAKHLELLKEIVPGLSSVAFLWNAASSSGALALQETQATARVLGVQLQSVQVRDANEFASAFEAITAERPAALIVFPEPLTFSHRGQIVGFAASNQLAMLSAAREFVDAGGLMSYGPSFPEMFRRAAVYVDKILQGTEPGELPVEQPTTFDLVINLKTAKALGLTIPPLLLFQATEVIR